MAGGVPLFVAEAEGSRFTDVDGHTYVDLCLGDTGASDRPRPPFVTEALAAQAPKGLTTMLPTEDAIRVAGELTRRFGLPVWQLAMTATDANRFALRLARHLTGRPKVAVFDCATTAPSTRPSRCSTTMGGRAAARQHRAGGRPAETTAVVPFNDVAALEAALAGGDVACVLAEPALTNIGIVLPAPGFHDDLRRLTRDAGRS